MNAKRLASGILALAVAGITACGGTGGDEPAELPGDALAGVETVSLDVEGMT